MVMRSRWLCVSVVAFIALLILCSGCVRSGLGEGTVVVRSVVRIMPLGDSITAGIGSTDGGGYRVQLWQDGEAAHWHFTFVGSQSSGPTSLPERLNEGHPGWRVDQLSMYVVQWLRTYQPQFILLHIGTNDILQHYQLNVVLQRLNYLLEQILNTLPHVTIIVAEITPLRNSVQNRVVAGYDHAIPALVRGFDARGDHVEAVDMYDAVTVGNLADGIHPNESGYRAMAGVWYSALRTYM